VLPDGTVTADDDVLSTWLGRPVALRAAGEATGTRRYENPADAEADADWESFEGAGGAFHDNADFRITLVSAGTIGGWDRRRFRANVVLDGAGEDDLSGSRVRLGDAVVDVDRPVPRCVMVTRPQPGGIDRDTGVLRTIHRERGGNLAVGGRVLTPGRVAVGDELRPA
jgi:uncharacterized protein YcbX